jgi:hypothetical protein
MEYEEYRRAYFADPAPEPRFGFASTGGAVLYFADYPAAIAYYTEVLGDPVYVEGEGTRSWRVGDSWLTLLAGGDGAPRNTEIGFLMESPDEADRLQAAFIAAGGTGPTPIDTLMGEPVRYCPVTDPFGTELLVYSLR